jgi:hypothetical protein
MSLHFEELWVKCEEFQQEANASRDIQSVIEELLLKINLYKIIDTKEEIPEPDRHKIKSRTLGEILLTLTTLSVKDNVNVYEALNIALQYRSLEHLNLKLPI